MKLKSWSAIFFCAVTLFACKEDSRVNRIEGIIYQDCDQKLGDVEIALKANVGNSFSEALILGSAIVDGNGYFNFTYELPEDDEGNGSIILLKSKGFETVLPSLKLNEDFMLTLYKENTASVVVQLDGTKNYTNTDTLFYGVRSFGIEQFIVQPANGILDTILASVTNVTGTENNSTFYYGLGLTEFNESKRRLSLPSDSALNHIQLLLNGCAVRDTAALVIN